MQEQSKPEVKVFVDASEGNEWYVGYTESDTAAWIAKEQDRDFDEILEDLQEETRLDEIQVDLEEFDSDMKPQVMTMREFLAQYLARGRDVPGYFMSRES